MDMQFLKRFPENKHEQIRQLMGYVSLLGITGKDLVSIGGYIERGKKREQALSMKEIAMAYKPEHMRGDAKTARQLHERFKIEYNGTWWAFERDFHREWKVTSRATGRRITHSAKFRDWGAWQQRRGWQAREELCMLDVLLDVHEGRLVLNF